MRYAINKDL